MQLAVSALQLLAGLLARSPQALAWMCGDTHRCERVYYYDVLLLVCVDVQV